MPTRRGFLSGLAASACAPSLSWADAGHPVALSAARLASGDFALLGLRGDGSLAFQVPLPGRGHAGAAHPHMAEAVVMARRPGRYALVIDCGRATVLQSLEAPKGRHFYGHCAFSADGDLLFTTENDFATGAGRVGVWQKGAGYTRIGELPSHGVGPHEVIRLSTGELAVANGGIRTHPEQGREKLNLETMRPNLAVISPEGELRDLAELPGAWHQNSLRHIAEGAAGAVICGLQWQGDPYEAPPLVALYRDGALRMVDLGEAETRALQGYVGSVSARGGRFALSSPRGGRVLSFDAMGGDVQMANAQDVCGLCGFAGDALATDGLGRVYRLGAAGLTLLDRHDLAFDNHLVAIA